jgi:glucokinase
MNAPQRAIGIDIGGTKIAVATVDALGTILARVTLATEAELGFERAIGRLLEAIDQVLTRSNWSRAELCGVGVGCTGPVSAERGIINNPYTLPTWVDCDIVSRLGAVVGKPVYLENDADAAALGEHFAGAARGFRQVVMLTFGTGVGGGVILDGHVYRGTRGEHPELGHIPVDADGPTCYCGMRGCLESIASGTAIAATGAPHFADARAVFAAAARGESAAVAIIERTRRGIETAAWTILHTFMPERIVLGGGIMDDHYALFAPSVAESIARSTMVPKPGTTVAKAGLSNDAGIVGAASLALRPASS